MYAYDIIIPQVFINTGEVFIIRNFRDMIYIIVKNVLIN